MRATQHFHCGLLLTTQRKEISKQEREKLFARESSQQAKEEREIFLGFLLMIQLNKLKGKAKLIFLDFLKVKKTHKKKTKKKKQNTMDDTMKKYER